MEKKKKRYERPNVGGVSINKKSRETNGAPLRKERAVDGPVTEASNW